ncbi:sugar phosphate nucleotidyltransferase, partial [bacterium]
MKQDICPLILLAGGLATRLRPKTLEIPKSLISICGEPFIAHQLRLLKNKGIKDVIISIGYKGGQIIDFIKDGKDFGVNISYANDGSELLGTGGAILNALDFINNESFFVMYGDSYLDIS